MARLPFDGSYPITQRFANELAMEPAGFKAPDGSINYRGDGAAGHWHNGIDFGLPCGTKLFSPWSGTVIASGMSPSGFGVRLMIQRADGLTALLGHMSAGLPVIQGTAVDEGQPVGESGDTGNSTGCHLHLSVIRGDGSYIDPETVIPPVQGTKPSADYFDYHQVAFSVSTQRDGHTRVWDGPSERLTAMKALGPGTTLMCTGWAYGGPKWDNAAQHTDYRWYHLSAGGWVASGRVDGNAPNSTPRPSS